MGLIFALLFAAPGAWLNPSGVSIRAPAELHAVLSQRRNSNGSASSTVQSGTPSPARVDIDRDAKIIVTNADDSLAHWSTCVEPTCNPGGKGIAVSTHQTIGNTDPSIDGSSMLLTQTADSRQFFTDVLWAYKSRACDDCTEMHTDFWAYPVSSAHVANLEYDMFLFDATRQLNLMWGTQWNQIEKRWQIWNQGDQKWIDTDVTDGPRFGAWNHIQLSGHRIIGDTNCNGTECLYYDTLTVNGTAYHLHRTEPAGPIHPGWHSVTGFQFQIDAAPVKRDGPITLNESIDQANMWAK